MHTIGRHLLFCGRSSCLRNSIGARGASFPLAPGVTLRAERKECVKDSSEPNEHAGNNNSCTDRKDFLHDIDVSGLKSIYQANV